MFRKIYKIFFCILIIFLLFVISCYFIQKGFNVVVLAPQCSENEDWVNKLNILAAIAPLAAATPIIPTTWNEQMISMPIWAFHGEKDTIAPLKNDEAMIDAIRKQGGTPRFTILPNQGHIIAGIYKNQELYDWFLTNTRH